VKIRSFKNVLSEFTYLLSNNKINVLSFLTNNYGDFYNKILIKKILKKEVHIVDINLYTRLRLNIFYKDKDIISGIGSILHYADKSTIVWGTGSVWPNSAPSNQPKLILAVRGKLTRKNLINNGYSCPDIFGDPGLLLKKYSDPEQYKSISKKYKIGIIPHKTDMNLQIINEYSKLEEVKIIDPENTKDYISDLLSCEKIASSSLHGLIFSDSFQIPNVWISLGNRITGKHFKYLDYYSSIYKGDIDNMKPLQIFSIDQLPEILQIASVKSIDLDINLLENQLINYYKSI
jgi:pyruvyltransferase